MLAHPPLHASRSVIDAELLAAWCSMAGLVAGSDPALLLEMHAGVVDMLLGARQNVHSPAVRIVSTG
jgi:hypothetical protein